jgi:hypothetical protein
MGSGRVPAALGTHLNGIPTVVSDGARTGNKIGEFMRRLLFGLRSAILRCIAVPGFALLLGVGAAIAQSGDLRAEDQSQKPPAAGAANPADATKDSPRKTDEFVEAAQAINGPAGNPECVWLGRRVVVLIWRDDLDTAFRHLDLYDRFGCPGGHVQAAFRCLTRFGGLIDPKVPASLNGWVQGCWINPNAQPQPAAAAQPAGTTAAAAAPAAAPPAAEPPK